MLGGVDSVAPFITVNQQSESNPDCNFHPPIALFASGRSYHQNLFTRLCSFWFKLINILLLKTVFTTYTVLFIIKLTKMRFRGGFVAVPENSNLVVISPYFAIFKYVVHSLKPVETPSNSVRLRLFSQFTYVQYCI